MRRASALAMLLLAVGIARADIGPPPGIKRIPYEAKITTEKELADFAFFAISGGDKATALKIDPKTPGTVKAAGGRYRFAELTAVPAAAAKGYATDKEFLAAVAKGKVDGQVKYKKSFNSTSDVKESDPRKSVVAEFKIVKIDAKEIVLEEAKPEPKESGKKSSLIIPGFMAFAGIALAGLWLVRRVPIVKPPRIVAQ